MTTADLKQLFPTLEESLLEELVTHGTIKKVKAGDILLRVGQTIRSTMLILNGWVKLYREDEEGKEFFIYHLDSYSLYRDHLPVSFLNISKLIILLPSQQSFQSTDILGLNLS